MEEDSVENIPIEDFYDYLDSKGNKKGGESNKNSRQQNYTHNLSNLNENY